ncbi:hypothetical protein AEP_03330 [Curvibacter sp. AEP1-3]|uniref:hypothetical protein n=1 Tax=Curvibacter sp. AEP1-3 TaxID=1844971 RepID=UPI000B3D3021|nr:hypothetical protein [Curvibacter sp. AEP1-3]ARV20252.1 hypothetical protein AEP_03330 [Curvibacter sp. AEP1-3]
MFQLTPYRAMLFIDMSSKKLLPAIAMAVSAMLMPLAAQADESDWSIGVYAGKYHDAEPAGALAGRANYAEHYMLAVTGSKTLWRHSEWPIAIELDGMLGQQAGIANLTEIAVAPALRWSGLPWRDTLRTDIRLAPLGLSYTSQVGPMEAGPDGRGSRTLNYLFVEAAFSRPQSKDSEFFVRLHHRCAIYDLLNNYGANGEDFLSFGFRRKF